jgi:hypothetical protein
MANTVIGVYEFYLQAQGATDALLASGFAPDHIRLKPYDETPAAREVALRPESESRAASHGIGHFFRLLFGLEDKSEHTDLYSEAVRRGSYVLTAQADSDHQVEQAVEIMNQHDPVDIDERSTRWRSEGWLKYDKGAPIFTDSEIARERSSAAASIQSNSTQEPLSGGGVKYGRVRVFKQAVQPRSPAQPEDTATHAAATAAASEKAGAGSDDDFRNHWQSVYRPSGARYEEYAPAYHFGYTEAGKERYRGHRWSDSEEVIRREWEASHAGSPWDKVRDAVRYGWEKVTY